MQALLALPLLTLSGIMAALLSCTVPSVLSEKDAQAATGGQLCVGKTVCDEDAGTCAILNSTDPHYLACPRAVCTSCDNATQLVEACPNGMAFPNNHCIFDDNAECGDFMAGNCVGGNCNESFGTTGFACADAAQCTTHDGGTCP